MFDRTALLRGRYHRRPGADPRGECHHRGRARLDRRDHSAGPHDPAPHRGAGRRACRRGSDRPDPVLLELFNNLFMNVAEQTGAVLQNTSMSVNIKERLDFSCAIFDAEGGLVANAPHVPVHLGAMGESVRTVLRDRGATLKPGDVVALNNPFNGGTHLPDVTVITPVFDDGGRGDPVLRRQPRPSRRYRRHHAGLDAAHVAHAGGGRRRHRRFPAGRWRTVSARRNSARCWPARKYPARSPDVNVADIKAQVAANEKGVQELKRVVGAVRLGHGQRLYAPRDGQRRGKRAAGDRPASADGAFDYTMDNGTPLACVDQRRSRDAQRDGRFHRHRRAGRGNFNSPPAVTRAAVLYVFRCLVGDDIPLNDGCLKPLEADHPARHVPVAAAGCRGGRRQYRGLAGHLQRAVRRAGRRSPARQATMNNFLFGDATRQYYETICGGTGAGPGFDGTSAMQTHMTNTRMTDPGGAGTALSGAAGAISRSAAARAATASGAAATARCGASGSSSR